MSKYSVRILTKSKKLLFFEPLPSNFNTFLGQKRKLLWAEYARTTRYSLEISKKISIDKSVRKSYNCHV